MEYNTQRNKLTMPEYGRGIQKMVELAVSLPDREERQRCANTIIKIMTRVQPEVVNQEDYTQKLWNHLARISKYQLDVDYPVEIVKEEEVLAHPMPLHYPMKQIRRKHYGHLIEQSLQYAQTLPDSEERDELVGMIANQMKQNLFVWNKDAMDENLVAQDISRYSHGELGIDVENFKFAAVGMPSTQQMSGSQGKRKKKR